MLHPFDKFYLSKTSGITKAQLFLYISQFPFIKIFRKILGKIIPNLFKSDTFILSVGATGYINNWYASEFPQCHIAWYGLVEDR